MHSLRMVLASTLLTFGCSGKEGDDGSGKADGDTDGGGDTGDGDPDSDAPCPDDVPEEYRYLWDCQVNSCDGGTIAYRRGVGASDANGDVLITENWYVFQSKTDYCIETFEIEGYTSDYDPETFNCAGCEEIYDIRWTMTTDNACGYAWGSIFIDDRDEVEGPFDGFVMFDTHTAFGDRNPENAMLVIAAPVSGNTYYPDVNYGKGTATPTTEDDAGPSEYLYTNSGSCWTSGR